MFDDILEMTESIKNSNSLDMKNELSKHKHNSEENEMTITK